MKMKLVGIRSYYTSRQLRRAVLRTLHHGTHQDQCAQTDRAAHPQRQHQPLSNMRSRNVVEPTNLVITPVLMAYSVSVFTIESSLYVHRNAIKTLSISTPTCGHAVRTSDIRS